MDPAPLADVVIFINFNISSSWPILVMVLWELWQRYEDRLQPLFAENLVPPLARLYAKSRKSNG